jgi:DNA-binding NarL/FixJ family response regulator
MRVGLADDSILLREGLARLLTDAGFEVVGQAGDAEELLDLVRQEGPDVVVVDVRMPPTYTNEGLVAAQTIRSARPSVGVLVLSHHVETGHAIDLLADGTGGVGYLLKDRVSDIEDFVGAVRRVGTGGSAIDPEVVSTLLGRKRRIDPLAGLTDREREVLELMAEGYSNEGIRLKLFVSTKTVETHVGSIFSKLGLLPAADENRRVLAVLAHLRSPGEGPDGAT